MSSCCIRPRTQITSGYQDFIVIYIDTKVQYATHLTLFKQTEIGP